MARSVKLLLTDNVESLGIVGDVVNVRTGYARNFLLPRSLATQPSEEKIKALATKRAEAEKMLSELRTQREATSAKLQGVEVTLIRSCNDQGHLYASITQQDLATALNEMGHVVKPRDVRLNQVMKRVDNYDVHIKLDSDLDATIKVHVQADRKLDLERHHEEHAAPAPGAEKGAETAEAGAEAGGGEPAGKGDKGDKGEKKEKKAKGERPEKGEKSDKPERADKGEKPEKGAKADKGAKGEKSDDKPAEKKGGSFSKASTKPDMPLPRPRREKRDR